MDWWEQVEQSDEVERKAERLANVLARQPGTRQEHLAFLQTNIPLMEAELEREGLDPTDSRRFGGGMKSLALRWWRNHRKTAPRVTEFESWPCAVRPLTEAEKAEIRAVADKTRKKHGLRSVK